MSFTGQIGDMLTRGDIENQTLTFVKSWLTYYLARVEQKAGLPAHSIATPKAYDVVDEFRRFPEHALPFIAVVSPGLSSGHPIEIDGDGMVTAWWLVAVGAVVSTPNMRSSKDLSGYYGAAIRTMMMQLPQLGGFASATEWTDERYDDFPMEQERSMAASRLVFAVQVPDVLNIYQGPRDLTSGGVPIPPTDPYSGETDYPVIPDIAHIQTELDKQ